MKRILKITGITMGSIVGAFLLYLSVAFCLSRIAVNANAEMSEEVGIYILTNGVHTDIVVPVKTDQKDWSASVLFNNTVAKDSSADWLALGWGDRGFYLETPTWNDLKASTAFKAAFGLSKTAMHCTFYKNLNEGKSCRRIGISREEYRKLIGYIENSFQKDASGNFIHIPTNANYGQNDAFYEAVGTYCLFGTCNSWANAALKSADQKACLWTAFDTAIFRLYE